MGGKDWNPMACRRKAVNRPLCPVVDKGTPWQPGEAWGWKQKLGFICSSSARRLTASDPRQSSLFLSRCSSEVEIPSRIGGGACDISASGCRPPISAPLECGRAAVLEEGHCSPESLTRLAGASSYKDFQTVRKPVRIRVARIPCILYPDPAITGLFLPLTNVHTLPCTPAHRQLFLKHLIFIMDLYP